MIGDGRFALLREGDLRRTPAGGPTGTCADAPCDAGRPPTKPARRPPVAAKEPVADRGPGSGPAKGKRIGAAGWNRTSDPQLRRLVLYPLSYSRARAGNDSPIAAGRDRARMTASRDPVSRPLPAAGRRGCSAGAAATSSPARGNCDAARTRNARRSPQGRLPHRHRRDGRGLPGARHAPGSRRRVEGAPARARGGSRAPAAVPAGGPGRLDPQPPEHRVDLRHRLAGRLRLHRDGVRRRRDARSPDPQGRDAARTGARDRDPRHATRSPRLTPQGSSTATSSRGT